MPQASARARPHPAPANRPTSQSRATAAIPHHQPGRPPPPTTRTARCPAPPRDGSVQTAARPQELYVPQWRLSPWQPPTRRPVEGRLIRARSVSLDTRASHVRCCGPLRPRPRTQDQPEELCALTRPAFTAARHLAERQTRTRTVPNPSAGGHHRHHPVVKALPGISRGVRGRGAGRSQLPGQQGLRRGHHLEANCSRAGRITHKSRPARVQARTVHPRRFRPLRSSPPTASAVTRTTRHPRTVRQHLKPPGRPSAALTDPKAVVSS